MADDMKKVKKLLESHPSLKITTRKEGKSRVLCSSTSHEMPCTLKAVETYVNGKKYKYECENRLTSKEQELSSQYLILKKRGQLFCTLTKRYLNNLPHHVKLHLKGHRFQRALAANNAEIPKSPEQKSSRHEDEPMQCDNDTEMWVPADSDSESEENDELGPDFELDRKDKTEDVYSFDILDTKPVAEMTKPVSKISNKSKIQKTGKRLRKNEVSKEEVLRQDQRKKKKKKGQ